MTIEQRKIDLINSITALNNEALLVRMQELVEDATSPIPSEIMSLLDKANKAKSFTEHTSARDIINEE